MIYGRLDVYWPTGPIESYQLEKSSIGIGRSTGNDIVLDTTAVSRYHVTLTYKEGQVVLHDLESANGTYVDGNRVKPQDSVVLRGGEEIQIGEIRMVYVAVQTLDLSTKPIPIPLEATRRIELVHQTFRVELEPPDQPVTPGAHVQAALTISNIGNASDRYSVEVEGVPKEWVRLDRIELDITPGGSAPVVVSFKPARRSESAPGDYSVIVRVRAKSQQGSGIEAPMVLKVRAFSGFGIVLGTPRVDPNTPFEVYLHNQGSAPLPLSLSGASPQSGLVFDLRPSSVVLAPGERKSVRGFVHSARRAMLGNPRELRFDVLARSQDPSGFLTAVQGTLVETPALPMWVATVVLPLIALAGVLIIAVGVFLLSRPRPPIINSFAISTAQALEGDTVVLSWNVTNAGELSLRVDNDNAVRLSPSAGQFSQVANASGLRTYTLIARNGGEVTQRTVQVAVAKPLKIDTFTVSPNPVFRYVRQEVTITWNVEGASGIQFQGVEGLTGNPDTGTHPPSGDLKLSGTPRDTLSLTMLAVGGNGQQVSQPVQVSIENPTCSASASLDVHSGPGMVYSLLRTLPIFSKVMPDGRDGSGQWLHLAPAPDLQAWVPVSGLTCDRFDPNALTLIEVVPPTPIPTVPPTVNPPSVTPTIPATIPPTAAPVTPVMAPSPTVPLVPSVTGTPANSIVLYEVAS